MLAALVASAFGVVGAVYMYARLVDGGKKSEGNNAYILENQVTHARLLPTTSAHAFTYPTLAFFLSLDALESHSLDVAHGWLFGYGGTSWRVTGLRSAAYLSPDVEYASPTTTRRTLKKSIRQKLQELLEEYGKDSGALGGVWMLTMPSYMGYEGINPLTVYYCYGKEGEGAESLAWVVLEIHNTFGEKHTHVLEPGVDEDESRPPGYDHQWTFGRDFHVSPFNDRLGDYTVSVNVPPPPSAASLATAPPRPKIRIHLYAPLELHSDSTPASGSKGPLKLTATLVARRAVPLTSASLVRALAKYPLALFLSFARILYHAWILHYVKRLDVFPRPDPKPAMRDWGGEGHARRSKTVAGGTAAVTNVPHRRAYGGIGWQEEGVLEAYSRRATERFLRRRVDELGVCVSLVSGDPAVPPQRFEPTSGSAARPGETLEIHYAAPRFFSTLLLAPSAEHMLLIGRTEDLVRVNSEELFLSVFSGGSSTVPSSGTTAAGSRTRTATQSLRASWLPAAFVRACRTAIPPDHPLDDGGGVVTMTVISLLHLADAMEKTVFGLLKARFAPGLEPWGRWERAGAKAKADAD